MLPLAAMKTGFSFNNDALMLSSKTMLICLLLVFATRVFRDVTILALHADVDVPDAESSVDDLIRSLKYHLLDSDGMGAQLRPLIMPVMLNETPQPCGQPSDKLLAEAALHYQSTLAVAMSGDSDAIFEHVLTTSMDASVRELTEGVEETDTDPCECNVCSTVGEVDPTLDDESLTTESSDPLTDIAKRALCKLREAMRAQ